MGPEGKPAASLLQEFRTVQDTRVAEFLKLAKGFGQYMATGQEAPYRSDNAQCSVSLALLAWNLW